MKRGKMSGDESRQEQELARETRETTRKKSFLHFASFRVFRGHFLIRVLRGDFARYFRRVDSHSVAMM